MREEGAQTLYTTDDTGNYIEYTPPEPPTFNESLPEDLRGNEHLKNVKDGAEMARYYVDLKSNYLKPPDTADGYEYEMPEGFKVEQGAYDEFKQVAFDNGINQKQFSALMDTEAKRHTASVEAIRNNIETRRAEAQKELKTEFGDQYDQKIESAKRFLNHEKLSGNGFKQFLEDTRFGDNPNVIRFLSQLSELISEDVFGKPGSGDPAPAKRVGEDGRPMLDFPSMEGK